MSEIKPQLPILTSERLEALERRVRGSPGLRAIETSATVIILGGVVYSGAVLYNVISGLSNTVEEAVSDVYTGVQVNPVVFSDEGWVVLEANMRGKRGGAIRLIELRMTWEGARDEFNDKGYVTALPLSAMRVHDWEKIIAHRAPGLLKRNEMAARVHPFDRAIGALLGNRASFWMIVGGLALMPVLPVIGSIFKEAYSSGDS